MRALEESQEEIVEQKTKVERNAMSFEAAGALLAELRPVIEQLESRLTEEDSEDS